MAREESAAQARSGGAAATARAAALVLIKKSLREIIDVTSPMRGYRVEQRLKAPLSYTRLRLA
jgi:hypothetical protein